MNTFTISKVLITLSTSLIGFGIALCFIVLDFNVYSRAIATFLAFMSGWGCCLSGWLLKEQWISVSTELPKEDGRYLVILNKKMIAIASFRKGRWSVCPEYISHWQNLPTKPPFIFACSNQ